jgi:hypothetical protein
MRQVFCVLLGFLLIVSGCSEHFSDHCIEMSGEIAAPTELRENYHPAINPITDIAGECLCQVEDAAFVSLMVVVWIGKAEKVRAVPDRGVHLSRFGTVH